MGVSNRPGNSIFFFYDYLTISSETEGRPGQQHRRPEQHRRQPLGHRHRRRRRRELLRQRDPLDAEEQPALALRGRQAQQAAAREAGRGEGQQDGHRGHGGRQAAQEK